MRGLVPAERLRARTQHSSAPTRPAPHVSRETWTHGLLHGLSRQRVCDFCISALSVKTSPKPPPWEHRGARVRSGPATSRPCEMDRARAASACRTSEPGCPCRATAGAGKTAPHRRRCLALGSHVSRETWARAIATSFPDSGLAASEGLTERNGGHRAASRGLACGANLEHAETLPLRAMCQDNERISNQMRPRFT